MSHSLGHQPVLLREAIDQLNLKSNGTYIDCTFGRGGHSRKIIDRLKEAGRLVAIDQDIEAVEYAKVAFCNYSNFKILHASFADLGAIVERLELVAKVDGILIDLGVSSPQLDQAQRGFSLKHNGPLDMRMDQRLTTTAASWLQQASTEEMTRIFRDYGEERYAGRIARRIVSMRAQQPLQDTLQLADLVRSAVPANSQSIHPATRVFQAIRIHVNDELGVLQKGLNSTAAALCSGGRLVVISFHSLEDRIVKRFLRGEPEPLELRKIPVRTPIVKPFRALGKVIKPSEAELQENPRSRSARMRVGERL